LVFGSVFFGFFANNSSAKIINTLDISRITPPPVPTPPTKPEPPDPPNPPCLNCQTPTPVPTIKPTTTPTSTSNPSQPSCGQDEHLDASGTRCVRFSDSGPGDSSSGGVGGAVLGASSMAGTGVAQETLFNLLFIVGCLATSIGLKKARTI
jgi:hypothetical protein